LISTYENYVLNSVLKRAIAREFDYNKRSIVEVLYASYREFTPCLNWNKLKQMYVNDT